MGVRIYLMHALKDPREQGRLWSSEAAPAQPGAGTAGSVDRQAAEYRWGAQGADPHDLARTTLQMYV